MNPKEELPALRVLARDRAVMYRNLKTLLAAADDLYLSANTLDEQVRDCEEIPEMDLLDWIETSARRFLEAGMQIASASDILSALIEVHGYDAIFAAFKPYYQGGQDGCACNTGCEHCTYPALVQVGSAAGPSDEGSE
jgi:hypothetical protein